jgi:hypothetical protein
MKAPSGSSSATISAGPAVGRLVLRGDGGVDDGLPAVPTEVERLREQGRRRVGEDEQWSVVHGGAFLSPA